jgi:hypothetical protein
MKHTIAQTHNPKKLQSEVCVIVVLACLRASNQIPDVAKTRRRLSLVFSVAVAKQLTDRSLHTPKPIV